MPHSPAFNEKRRAAYRQARRLGLTPREAGHVYTDETTPQFQAKVRAAYQAPVPGKRIQLPPAQERHEEVNRRRKAQGLPPSGYQQHTYYETYYKVRIDWIDSDGFRGFTYLEVATRKGELSREQVMNDARASLDANRGHYPVDVIGLSVEEVIHAKAGFDEIDAGPFVPGPYTRME